MNNIFVKVALIVTAFSPVFVFAGPIVRSGESISIDATQILKSDFYGLAPTVTLSGQAEEDASIAGGTVTINATVAKDLTIIGGVVQIHGDVGDDLRIVGGEVTLANEVKGDVVVLGGTLTILSTAKVGGDVLFMGGELAIEGGVTGGVYGTAGTVRINSEVGGDVSLNIKNSFTTGDNANIVGNVKYESFSDLVRAQNTTIGGEVSKIDIVADDGKDMYRQLGLYLIVLLFSALTMYLVLRKYIEQIVTLVREEPGVSGLVGIGVFIILPFVSGVLLVSMIGTFVGIALFAFYIVLCLFAFFGAGILLGVYVQKLLTQKAKITFSTVVLGVVSLVILGLVPIIGGIAIFGLMLMMLGGAGKALYFAIRK